MVHYHGLLYFSLLRYYILCNQTTYGALFTSLGWIIVTAIYSFYINNYAHYQVFYGGFANIIILMLWTYFLALIFVIGLALNYRRDELGYTWENHLIKKKKNKEEKKEDIKK